MSNFCAFLLGYAVATIVATATILATRIALIKGENK